jgi:uncharacterized protein (TIGR02444 family)
MSSLLDYATRLYQQQAVQNCCLHLQDNYQVDVPCALFLCWYADTSGAISDELAAAAFALNQAISEGCVQPLRKARRWMKQGWPEQEALRQKIKTAELEAEFSLLLALAQLCPEPSANPDAGTLQLNIQHNLRSYFNQLSRPPAQAQWQVLADAACALRAPAQP